MTLANRDYFAGISAYSLSAAMRRHKKKQRRSSIHFPLTGNAKSLWFRR